MAKKQYGKYEMGIMEAAKRLGVTREKVDTWIKQGLLKFDVTSGGRRKYTKRTLLNLAKNIPIWSQRRAKQKRSSN